MISYVVITVISVIYRTNTVIPIAAKIVDTTLVAEEWWILPENEQRAACAKQSLFQRL